MIMMIYIKMIMLVMIMMIKPEERKASTGAQEGAIDNDENDEER